MPHVRLARPAKPDVHFTTQEIRMKKANTDRDTVSYEQKLRKLAKGNSMMEFLNVRPTDSQENPIQSKRYPKVKSTCEVFDKRHPYRRRLAKDRGTDPKCCKQ